MRVAPDLIEDVPACSQRRVQPTQDNASDRVRKAIGRLLRERAHLDENQQASFPQSSRSIANVGRMGAAIDRGGLGSLEVFLTLLEAHLRDFEPRLFHLRVRLGGDQDSADGMSASELSSEAPVPQAGRFTLTARVPAGVGGVSNSDAVELTVGLMLTPDRGLQVIDA